MVFPLGNIHHQSPQSAVPRRRMNPKAWGVSWMKPIKRYKNYGVSRGDVGDLPWFTLEICWNVLKSSWSNEFQFRSSEEGFLTVIHIICLVLLQSGWTVVISQPPAGWSEKNPNFSPFQLILGVGWSLHDQRPDGQSYFSLNSQWSPAKGTELKQLSVVLWKQGQSSCQKPNVCHPLPLGIPGKPILGQSINPDQPGVFLPL